MSHSATTKPLLRPGRSSKQAMIWTVLGLVFLLVIPVSIPAHAQEPPRISLTAAEREWISQHLPIRLVLNTDQAPAAMLSPQGELIGIFPDLLADLGRIIGHDLNLFAVADSEAAHESAKSREIHGNAAVFDASSHANDYLLTQPYMHSPFLVITRASRRPSIRSERDLQGLRIALPRGHRAVLAYVNDIAGSEVVMADSMREQLLMVSNGEADALVGYPTHRAQLHQSMMLDLAVAFETPPRYALHIGINPAYPELLTILNKAIEAQGDQQRYSVLAGWGIRARDLSPPIELTQAEKAWLAAGHEVRVKVRDWPPFMFEQPEPTGVAIETLKRLSGRLGIGLQFVRNELGWLESLADLAGSRQHYDLIPVMTRTPQRASQFAMTDDYLRIPLVIVTRVGSSPVQGMDDLRGKVVSAERGFVMHDKLASNYPDIQLLGSDSSLAAIEAVSVGQAFAYIGNLANASYHIRAQGLSNVRVAALSPFGDQDLAMAARSDWPELASILNKGLATMSAEERIAINEMWLNIGFEPGIAPRTVAAWVAVVIAVAGVAIGLILLWNRAIRKEVARRRTAEWTLEKLLHSQSERIKELKSIFGITELVRNLDSIDEILQASASAIPRGMQYPEYAQVRITFDDKVFTNADFVPGGTSVDAELLVNGKVRGQVSAFYSELLPAADTGPFLTEEHALLQGVSATLGGAIGRREAEDELRHLAFHDPLTGLVNRGVLLERLQQEVSRAGRNRHPLCVLFLDLDHFKRVNDDYGHSVGDRVLCELAALLADAFRQADVCGRYGGEEFAVILPETTATAALEIAERLRRSIADFAFYPGDSAPLHLTVSIGMACYPDDSENSKELLHLADKAMYEAKKAGRNRVMAASQITTGLADSSAPLPTPG